MRSTKTYFDFPFGQFSGLLLDEHAMKKVAKLLYKQNQELKELLQANIDHCELSNWTLAYPNGEQKVIKYVDKNTEWETKEHRISLIDKMNQINRVEHLYFCSQDEAISEHMKLYDDQTEVKEESS